MRGEKRRERESRGVGEVCLERRISARIEKKEGEGMKRIPPTPPPQNILVFL